MGYLVCNGKVGTVKFSGTQYVNPTNGTKRLCIRTGTNPNDIVKYGLTTNSSASNYCGMRMRIDGNTAYIGRSEEPLLMTYTTKNTIKTSAGGSRLNTGIQTLANTLSYSSTRVSSKIGGMSLGTYTYTISRTTSIRDEQCTEYDSYRTSSHYKSYTTYSTSSGRKTVSATESINYETVQYITRSLSFTKEMKQDEDNFNL